jgi:hypothetical protein
MKANWAFFLSLVIHILILCGLIFLRSSRTPSSQTSQSVAIEIVPAKSHAAGGSIAKVGSTRARSNKVTLENLKLSDMVHVGGAVASEHSGGGLGWSNEDWGSGGGDLRHVESTSGLQALATELDGAMTYPDALLKRDMQGSISARLFLRKEGGCDWQRSKILPGEPHLRVYVLGILKKVCGLGQIAALHFQTSEFADLSFNFHLVDTDDITESPPPWITGNVIGLERQRHRFPFKIPLGPIVLFGGDLVHVDFGWLFDQWDLLVGQKKDPMAAFQ